MNCLYEESFVSEKNNEINWIYTATITTNIPYRSDVIPFFYNVNFHFDDWKDEIVYLNRNCLDAHMNFITLCYSNIIRHHLRNFRMHHIKHTENTIKQSQHTNAPKDTKKHTDILLHIYVTRNRMKGRKQRKIVERFPFFFEMIWAIKQCLWFYLYKNLFFSSMNTIYFVPFFSILFLNCIQISILYFLRISVQIFFIILI